MRPQATAPTAEARLAALQQLCSVSPDELMNCEAWPELLQLLPACLDPRPEHSSNGRTPNSALEATALHLACRLAREAAAEESPAAMADMTVVLLDYWADRPVPAPAAAALLRLCAQARSGAPKSPSAQQQQVLVLGSDDGSDCDAGNRGCDQHQPWNGAATTAAAAPPDYCEAALRSLHAVHDALWRLVQYWHFLPARQQAEVSLRLCRALAVAVRKTAHHSAGSHSAANGAGASGSISDVGSRVRHISGDTAGAADGNDSAGASSGGLQLAAALVLLEPGLDWWHRACATACSSVALAAALQPSGLGVALAAAATEAASASAAAPNGAASAASSQPFVTAIAISSAGDASAHLGVAVCLAEGVTGCNGRSDTAECSNSGCCIAANAGDAKSCLLHALWRACALHVCRGALSSAAMRRALACEDADKYSASVGASCSNAYGAGGCQSRPPASGAEATLQAWLQQAASQLKPTALVAPRSGGGCTDEVCDSGTADLQSDMNGEMLAAAVARGAFNFLGAEALQLALL